MPRPQTVAAPPIPKEILHASAHALNRLGGPNLPGLAVTSALSGEGRTLIAAAIAHVQAHEFARPTLLVDTAFERPALAGRFELPEGPGLAQVVAGRASVEDALYPVGDGLTVMPTGDFNVSPARLATEFLASNLLNELREDFKVIVADLPAILESTYAALLARAFDQRLLVVRARVTPVSMVREAMSQLDKEPAVLLNGTYSKVPRRLRRFFL
jgi:Mrp family chromosome partitioning ATPase